MLYDSGTIQTRMQNNRIIHHNKLSVIHVNYVSLEFYIINLFLRSLIIK